MAGASADPTTVVSCTGCTACGTCTPSFLNMLPSLFSSAGKTVAAITQSNDAVQIAQTNAAATVAQTQAKTAVQPQTFMMLGVGLGVAVVLFLVFKK